MNATETLLFFFSVGVFTMHHVGMAWVVGGHKSA